MPPTTRGSVLLNTLAGVAVTCAVVTTGLAVRRELAPSARAPQQKIEPVEVEDWRRLLTGGHRIGPENAKVTILEFADFECSACRRFTIEALHPMLRKYPDDVAVVYRHWPLQYHRFAYPAALASECAASQGRFREYHDALFLGQNKLGLTTWMEFATQAGVKDTQAFRTCLGRTDSLPSIISGQADARGIGGEGTPVVIINGWRWPGGPDSARLEQEILKELKKTR